MIFDNLKSVLGRIERAAHKSGRQADEIELVAVTKKAEPETMAELLLHGGIKHIGESRVQAASRKAQALGKFPALPGFDWRMVGHLQTNKVREALEVFDSIDSLDSIRLAQALQARLTDLGKKLPVLVQVKLTQRQEQSGVTPESLEEFLTACRAYDRLEIRGLMAIAPMLEPVEAVRPHFKRMKTLSDRFFPQSAGGGILSMGMSGDFEIAVEEGATMVRLGTVLFA